MTPSSVADAASFRLSIMPMTSFFFKKHLTWVVDKTISVIWAPLYWLCWREWTCCAGVIFQDSTAFTEVSHLNSSLRLKTPVASWWRVAPQNLIATSFFDSVFTSLFSARKPVNEMASSSLLSVHFVSLTTTGRSVLLRGTKLCWSVWKFVVGILERNSEKKFAQIVGSWDGNLCDSVCVNTVKMAAECDFFLKGSNCTFFVCVHQYHYINHRQIHSYNIRYSVNKVVI
jgi:hypothetical protein